VTTLCTAQCSVNTTIVDAKLGHIHHNYIVSNSATTNQAKTRLCYILPGHLK